MIYLVYGEQELLVNKMIDKIAKDTLKEIDEFNERLEKIYDSLNALIEKYIPIILTPILN